MKIAVCDDDRESCIQMRRLIQRQKPDCEVVCFYREGQQDEARRYFEELIQDIGEFQTNFPEKIFFRTKSRNFSLWKKDILYVESRKRKVEIHTEKECISVYATMKWMEEQLGGRFYRCHRGYLVNMEYVKDYDAGAVYLKNGDKVYLAREKYQDFARAWEEYPGRE